MYAVCLGLVAAAVFGAASVLEEGSTKQVQQRAALSPRLLADLVRRPLFLAAIGMNAAGAGMQILALHLGSLTLVQPLLVLSLLFAVVIAALAVRRRPPDGVLLAGVADPLVSMAAGAAFLHEKIAAAPADLAAESLFLAMTVGGIIALAQRAPQAAKDHATDAGLPALASTRVSLMAVASGACGARAG